MVSIVFRAELTAVDQPAAVSFAKREPRPRALGGVSGTLMYGRCVWVLHFEPVRRAAGTVGRVLPHGRQEAVRALCGRGRWWRWRAERHYKREPRSGCGRGLEFRGFHALEGITEPRCNCATVSNLFLCPSKRPY